MKILAIASGGGHWIQLQRVMTAFQDNQLIYLSTHPSFAQTVEGYDYYTVPDASRWNRLKLLLVAYKVFRIISTTRPEIVISTGAAPGVMGILAGKLLGARTVWIDSIANVDQLSLSGKLILRIADRVYTQWPDLATGRIMYAGNVLSESRPQLAREVYSGQQPPPSVS